MREQEEVIDVVRPISQGAGGSLYVLIPKKLAEKRKIVQSTEFVVLEAENGDIIYRRKKEA
jgi:antitoxin component of MazEF toxin-antitoxin module